MNRESLLGLYEKFTGLIEKLPGGLQKPILSELVPIRELFLEQRPARLLLLGDPEPRADAFFSALAASGEPRSNETEEGAPPPHAPPPVERGESDDGWRTLRVPVRGTVQVLDARQLDDGAFEGALRRALPDAAVVFQSGDGPETAARFQAAVTRVCRADDLRAQAAQGGTEPPRGGTPGNPPQKSAAEKLPAPKTPVFGLAGDGPGAERLRALLLPRKELAGNRVAVFWGGGHRAFGAAVCDALPNPAKLEFALFANLRAAKSEIAKSLLKSFTAVCGVIGMQPIPLADLPILASLQSLMVGLIAYTSGRRMDARTAAEFCGSVGLSFGLGMLFREGARAAIKVLPGFGNAVSGLVAGAGTYAIGRAAIAYFIDDLPAAEAKKLFDAIRPKRGTFLRRRNKSLQEPPPLPDNPAKLLTDQDHETR